VSPYAGAMRTRNPGPVGVAAGLVGRRAEIDLLDAALDDARLCRSRTLVIRGEAGIGKTALLQQAIARASDFRVLRCSGVDIVERVDHAALYGACRPLLDRIDLLAPPQRTALRTAFALDGGPPSTPLTLGVAVLSLLADAAESGPLLLVVDDAHWLDEASLAALAFAAHRFQADSVACLFATRRPAAEDRTLAGLDNLDLGPLPLDDSLRLLERLSTSPLSADDRRFLLRQAAGNPLALREFARANAADAVARWGQGVVPLSAGASVEDAFAVRFRELPAPARLAATIAAAAGGDLAGTGAALDVAGVGLEALDAVEDAGLMHLDAGEICFVHPLARSAAYAGASAAERRAAHRAHAQALGARDPERRAWHLGAAAATYDDEAAEALEQAASAARSRGQFGAQSAALHRAARLTRDAERRAERLLAAAVAMESTSMPSQASALLDEALAATADPTLRARIEAQSALVPSDLPHAERLRRARRAALAARCVDPALSVRALREAVAAAAALPQPVTIRRLGQVAVGRAAQAGNPALSVVAHISLAWGSMYEGRPQQAIEAVQASARSFRRIDLLEADVWTLNSALNGHLIIGDHAGGRRLASRVAELARSRGQAFLLVRALDHASLFDIGLGHWDRAVQEADEACGLGEALSYPLAVYNGLEQLAELAAMRGDPDTPALCEDATVLARSLAQDRYAERRLQPARALYELGIGELERCAARLERLAARRRAIGIWDPVSETSPLLVEAYAALGRDQDARTAQQALQARVERYVNPAVHARTARAAAIVADDYETAFARALRLHDADGEPFERARTLLLLGERRRRDGSMRAARDPLRMAAATFARLRAQTWLERAQRELGATGERRRRAQDQVELTPQERRIVDLAREGRTNREIGTALFLSPKTVEYHLGNAYRKLGVRSRTELAARRAS
jgi:DNA-binding CsgD family transcriptional regulator